MRDLLYKTNKYVDWDQPYKTIPKPFQSFGISGYNLIQDTTRKEASQKGVLCAKVIIYPVYPVEDFYIDVVIENEEITIV